MDHAVDHLLFSHPEITDEFLKTATACTHTHTCDPPGPSSATMHTHACLHTHLQVFSSGESTVVEEGDPRTTKPRKPLGNREAVRKYREKKKAHAAFLEKEVGKLRAANQQLLKRLQGFAALEAEVVRLRGLLFGVRGKILSSEINACCDERCAVPDSDVKCTDPSLCFDDAELAAPEECCGAATIFDFEIDERGGNISRDLDNPDVHDSMMDVVANLVK